MSFRVSLPPREGRSLPSVSKVFAMSCNQHPPAAAPSDGPPYAIPVAPLTSYYGSPPDGGSGSGCDCPAGEDDDQPSGCYEARSLMDVSDWRHPSGTAVNTAPDSDDRTLAVLSGPIWEMVPASRNPVVPEPRGGNRNGHSIVTHCKYSDFLLKFEFRCPNMRKKFTDASGLEGPENWGNSGVKILDANDGYEVQIVDSLGFSVGTDSTADATHPKPNGGDWRLTNGDLCGAIYHTRGPEDLKRAPGNNPVLNPAENSEEEGRSYRPDGDWNTMEIGFMSARYKRKANGKGYDRVKCSTITVKINDVPVQHRIGLAPLRMKDGKLVEKFDEEARLVCDTHYDKGGPHKGYCKASGPILLQEHDTPVQFRNIWVDPGWSPGDYHGEPWQRATGDDCLPRK